MSTDSPLEVGGYFGLEGSAGSLFHDDAILLNTGRNALVYLLEARQIQTLWLPDYLCDSVPVAAHAHGTELRTYPIRRDLGWTLPDDLDADDWLYVVNHFGQIDLAALDSMRAQHPRIIVDNAQAFFTPAVPGIDTLYTCRKFFGVADGAMLVTDARLARDLPRGTSAGHMAHVLGRVESTASAHYDAYRASEQRLVGLPVQRMSVVTEQLLRAADHDAALTARARNFAALDAVLGGQNELEVTSPAGPYAYPFLHPLGSRLRPLLHARRIYVPLLWPNVLADDGAGADSRYLADNLIPLPVDQRYDIAVMAQLADAVKEVLDDAR